MILRGFPNIISNDIAATRRWYEELLGWDTEFESDWFVHLRATDRPDVELGIITATHEIVPKGIAPGSSALLTFVVEDVDSLHDMAIGRGDTIIEPPTNMFYGQRRMILRDPDGTMIDVSSECPPSQEFLDSLPHSSEH